MPFYVYQYATSFASSAQLMKEIAGGAPAERAQAVDRYLTLLEAGGSEHPMTLLRRAGVDLSRPETVQATTEQLDDLVTRLEGAL
jgi:oligoendopeptidase F